MRAKCDFRSPVGVFDLNCFIQVCNFFSPFDRMQTSEVCNSPTFDWWDRNFCKKKLLQIRLVLLKGWQHSLQATCKTGDFYWNDHTSLPLTRVWTILCTSNWSESSRELYRSSKKKNLCYALYFTTRAHQDCKSVIAWAVWYSHGDYPEKHTTKKRRWRFMCVYCVCVCVCVCVYQHACMAKHVDGSMYACTFYIQPCVCEYR